MSADQTTTVAFTAPDVTSSGVVWQIPADAAPGGVRLVVDWVLPGTPEFTRDGEWWRYELARPAARRLEYRLFLAGPDGSGHPDLDPGNPHRVRNPFGDRSVIEFSDYVAPEWVGTEPEGELADLDLPPGRLGLPVPSRLWSPTGLDPAEPAALLVANDGTGLASDANLLGWATWRGRVSRPIRVLLLDPAPGERDAWYAANDDYADEIVGSVLPAVRERVAVGSTIGLGISLGAVATLTLQRRHPLVYDGIALQSGSFFTPATDPQEAGYSRFDQVCSAVRRFRRSDPERIVPVFICCGAIEENLVNNLQLAQALSAQGYPLTWRVFGDGHTMTGWRDAWSPELDRLVDRSSVHPGLAAAGPF